MVNQYSRQGTSNFRETKKFFSDIFAHFTRGKILEMTEELFEACKQPRFGSVPTSNLVDRMMQAFKDEKENFVDMLKLVGFRTKVILEKKHGKFSKLQLRIVQGCVYVLIILYNDRVSMLSNYHT